MSGSGEFGVAHGGVEYAGKFKCEREVSWVGSTYGAVELRLYIGRSTNRCLQQQLRRIHPSIERKVATR